MRVTSTEFQQNVGRFQDAAQRGPVAITKNGRTHTVLVSAAMFDVLLKGRIARLVEDLDSESLASIAETEVSSKHDELDALLKDWAP